MDLQIGPGGCFIKKQIGDRILSRPVRFREVIKTLSPANELEFGLLPPNTRWVSQKTGGAITLLVEVPRSKYTIHVKHDSGIQGGAQHTVNDVPLPTAVIGITLLPRPSGGYSSDKVRVVAITTDRLESLEQPAFNYPLPNVYHGTHHVCWHTASIGTFVYKHVSAAEDIVSRFFRSSVNDHLFAKSRLSQEFPWDGIADYRHVELFFKKLSDHGQFENHWLSAANISVRDALLK